MKKITYVTSLLYMMHILAMQQQNKMDSLLQVAAKERAKLENPMPYQPTEVFECNYPGCTKAYPLKGSLDAHKLTHREKNTACNICGKLFIHGDSVRQHKRLMHPDISKQ